MKKQISIKTILLIGIGLAVAVLFALMSVSAGPLSQLDQIGGWALRQQFILLTCIGLFLVFSIFVVMFRPSYNKFALYMLVLCAGFMFRAYALDQLTPEFIDRMVGTIRYAAKGDWTMAVYHAKGAYSPVMLMLLGALGRLPFYELYSVKLLIILCDLVCVLLVTKIAGRFEKGRMELTALLFATFSLGSFLIGAYGAQIEAIGLVFALLALLLLLDGRRVLPLVLIGVGFMVHPMVILVLPICLWAIMRRTLRVKELLLIPASALLTGVPAIIAGFPLKSALALHGIGGGYPKLLTSNAPSLYNLFMRPSISELPEYSFLRYIKDLRQLDISLGVLVSGPTMVALRQAGFVLMTVMVVLLLCLCIRKGLAAQEGSEFTWLLLTGLVMAFLMPGRDAGTFYFIDIFALLYAMRFASRWRISGLVMGATLISAIAHVTQYPIIPQTVGTAMNALAIALLIKEVLGESIGQDEIALHTPERI